MEAITIIVALIFIVFGVLQIILFFKMWSMTNDVRRIADKLTPSMEQPKETPIYQEEVEDPEYTSSVWKCPKCNTLNHYKKQGDSVCKSCGHILK